MAPALELSQNALARHLALEVLDGALDAFVTDGNLERLALHGVAGLGGSRLVDRLGLGLF